MGYRVYVVDFSSLPEESPNPRTCTDVEFIDIAEAQKNVYTLLGFQQAFNNEEINEINSYIRILRKDGYV